MNDKCKLGKNNDCPYIINCEIDETIDLEIVEKQQREFGRIELEKGEEYFKGKGYDLSRCWSEVDNGIVRFYYCNPNSNGRR